MKLPVVDGEVEVLVVHVDMKLPVVDGEVEVLVVHVDMKLPVVDGEVEVLVDMDRKVEVRGVVGVTVKSL
jgi:hypothetical protein